MGITTGISFDSRFIAWLMIVFVVLFSFFVFFLPVAIGELLVDFWIVCLPWFFVVFLTCLS